MAAFEWDHKHGHPKGWWKGADKMSDAWERKLKKEQRELKAKEARKKNAEEKQRLKLAAYRKEEKERLKQMEKQEKERQKAAKLRIKQQKRKVKRLNGCCMLPALGFLCVITGIAMLVF